MKRNDEIRMTINIAGQRIPLTVGFDEQNDVRDTERSVGALYDKWRQRFPNKSTQELLAMMTYQYASFYRSLCKRMDAVGDSLAEQSAKLDGILAGD